MDIILLAIKNISRKPLRAVLTMLGISIGIMAVVIISGIGDMGKYSVNRELEALGMSGISISVNNRSSDMTLKETQLQQIKNQSYVKSATPILVDFGVNFLGGKTGECLTFGIDETASSVISLELLKGRMINHSDIYSCSEVCLVDEALAKAVYKRTNIVGKTMNISIGGNSRSLKIVGVVKAGSNALENIMGEYIPSFVYVPYNLMQIMCGREDFDQIAVKLKNNINADTATGMLQNELERASGTEGWTKAQNLNKQKDRLNSVLGIITLILSAIAGISLIVAGLSIMTSMIVSVNERTREIGIKKSIGASNKAILLEFIYEALFISLAGSLAGIFAGTVFTSAASLFLGLPVFINIKTLGLLIIFSIIMGIIFGAYPAKKASGLKPARALQNI